MIALVVALLWGSMALSAPAPAGSGAPSATDDGGAVATMQGSGGSGAETGTAQPAGAPPVAGPAPTLAAAMPAEVDVQVTAPNPEAGPIGALQSIDVTVRMPPGAALQTLTIDERTFVELVRVDDGGPSGDPTLVTRTMWVTSFRTGVHAVPGVVVHGIDASGRPFEATSSGFEVTITGVTVNESNPEPTVSEPPVPVLIRDMRPVWLAVVVGAGAMGALLWSVWRRRTVAVEVTPVPPPRPPLEVALEKLAQLADDGLLAQGEHLMFHERLSAIVREFVGRIWGFDGVERTTTEIRDELLVRAAAQRWEARLIALLSDTDLVKFARFTPPAEMSQTLLAEARELVLDIAARIREEASPADVPAPPSDEGLPSTDDGPTTGERT